MITPPRRNLPPGSEAWGRYVDKRLSELKSSDDVQRVNIGASIQSIAASSHHTAEHKYEVDGRLEHVDEALEELDNHLDQLQEDLDGFSPVTTSDSEPTEEDGEGLAEGAYWYQVDSSNEQVGRWRWDGSEWVSMPLSPTFIPEIGTDKIIASEAGFDVAVANQMYVDMFTTNRLTADEIDVNNLRADGAFVGQLFGQDISISGELNAYSDNYITTLSQSGIEMYSNNTLERNFQYAVSDFILGWPADHGVSFWAIGDLTYFYQYGAGEDKIVAKDSQGITQWERSYPDYMPVSVSGYGDVLAVLELGFISAEWVGAIRTLDPLTGESKSSFSVEPVSAQSLASIAVDPDDTSQAIVAQLNYASGILRLQRWDLDQGVFVGDLTSQPTPTGEFPRFGGMVISDGYVFYGVNNYYAQYDLASGTLAHRIALPGTIAGLDIGDGLVWVSISGVDMVAAYDVYSGELFLTARKNSVTEPVFTTNLEAVLHHGGVLVGLDFVYGELYELSTYTWVENHELRVSLDNIEGKLTAVEAELDTIRSNSGDYTTAYGLVSPDFNQFLSLQAADDALRDAGGQLNLGTRIIVNGVEYVSDINFNWVPAGPLVGTENSGIIQGNHGTRNNHTRAAWFRTGDIVYLQGTVTRGSNDDYSGITLSGLPAPDSQRRFLVTHTNLSGAHRDPWIMVVYDDGTAAFFDGQDVNAALNLDGLSYIIPDIG